MTDQRPQADPLLPTSAERPEGRRPRLSVVGQGASALGLDRGLRSPHALPAGPHNLPDLPPFVGRERELAEVVGAMTTDRLVTLTGPSGIGKTRLALEVASRTHGSYPNGAWLVELAPVCEPRLVPQAVASALGLDPQPGRDTVDAIAAHLCMSAPFLVLDNCEHILEACAELVDGLLSECRWLRILATSQQELGVEGERPVPLPPLPLLHKAPDASVEDAMECEAVALFCARAAAASPGFTLTEETLPAVAEICERLDGIPLAIELAAARISALGPADIADRLEKRFRLLTGGPKTAEARHRTLRAAIDWSYDLLSTEQARLFRQLSVFPGGSTLHAIEEVCTADAAPRADAVGVMTSLVGKSLVMADTTRSRVRYRMLETIRAYACERLEEEGETAEVQSRLARWAVSLVERAWYQVGSDKEQFWANAIEADHDNVRATLEWTVANEPDLALRLTASLTSFWKTRGYLQEGQDWLRQALDASAGLDGPSAVRAQALHGFAMLATVRGEVTVARPAAEESLRIAREGQFRRAETHALNLLGFISIFTQDPVAAKPLLEESVDKARAEGDPELLIGPLALYGRAHLFTGDLDAAGGVFGECLALNDAGGDSGGDALIGLGSTALAAGELGRAEELLRRALRILQDAGERYETALVLSYLGELAWIRGRHAEATSLLEEGRDLAVAMGTPFPLARCLYGLAKVAYSDDDLDRTKALVDEACDVADRACLPYARVRALHVLGELRRAHGDREGARAAYEQALRVARANADKVGAAVSLCRLARVARSDGADDEAVALVGEAIGLHAEAGDAGLFSSLELMAGLATDQGRTVSAATLFGAAQGLRDAIGSIRPPDEVADYERDLSTLRAALEPGELDAAWAEGAAMSREGALALALEGRGTNDRPSRGWSSLSPKERQIAELAAEGLSTTEIAEKMFRSPRTVQSSLTRVYSKLGVSRREIRDARRRR